MGLRCRGCRTGTEPVQTLSTGWGAHAGPGRALASVGVHREPGARGSLHPLCWSRVSFQEAGAGASSRARTGTAPRSSKPWQDEPAAKTGRGASATRAGRCSASFRCAGALPCLSAGLPSPQECLPRREPWVLCPLTLGPQAGHPPPPDGGGPGAHEATRELRLRRLCPPRARLPSASVYTSQEERASNCCFQLSALGVTREVTPIESLRAPSNGLVPNRGVGTECLGGTGSHLTGGRASCPLVWMAHTGGRLPTYRGTP